MTQVLVHFGFHKTGTSTTERTLEINREVLAGSIEIVTRKTWPEVTRAAKQYSLQKTAAKRAAFGAALGQRLQVLDGNDRDLCISNVDLCGHMPGHRGIADYSAVPGLLGEICGQIEQRYGTRVDLTFFASIRPADAWLKSLYWQNLKVQRLTDNFDDFARRFRAASDFSALSKNLRGAIGARKLMTSSLTESAAHRLGPAAPILTKLGVPAPVMIGLVAAPRLKVSLASEIQQSFLDLNRSSQSDADVAEAKADALAILNAV